MIGKRAWILFPACALWLTALAAPTLAGEARQATPPVPAAAEAPTHPTGYHSLKSFGGPSSVSSQLRADHSAQRLRRRGPLSRQLQPYYAFKKRLLKRHGLSFGLDYNLFTQHATARLPTGPDDATGGVFRFYGSWALLKRNTDCQGSFVWKVENRSALGSDLPPNSLGPAVGSLLPSATSFNDWGWGVTNLQWQQSLRFGHVRAGFALGQVDATDWVDVNLVSNPWTGFVNILPLQYATNPVPDQGLGVMGFAVFRSRNTPYVLAGLSDANGTPTRAGFETLFDTREFYTYAEFGWTPSYAKRYEKNVHVSVWHQDAREAAGVPADWGLSASGAWTFCNDRLRPFVHAGISDGNAAAARASVACGTGYSFRTGDALGLSASWARPSDGALRDQYALQLFYNLALGEHVHLTPDLQVLVDPIRNPTSDVIAFLGLRLRVDF